MTKRHYFQSLIILLMAFYIVRTIFELHYVETIVIIVTAIVCVLHTMDVRDDILEKIHKPKKGSNGNRGSG